MTRLIIALVCALALAFALGSAAIVLVSEAAAQAEPAAANPPEAM